MRRQAMDQNDDQLDRARLIREAAERASGDFEDLEIADVDPLADTVGDDLVAADAPEPGEAFDKLFGHEIVSLDAVDPEAGKRGVASRVRLARRAARTPGGRMVTATPPMMVGLAVGIFALVHQTTALWIAAGVLTLPTFVWWVFCYRQWLGHKRYAYRLLESLGEDVSEFRTDQIYKPTKVHRSRRRR